MAIAKNPKVIMTESQFISRLQALASRKTYYKNKYPYNLCYIHNDNRTSADCVNLIKALLNGYDVTNTKPGYYQRDLSNTGDCTEAELLCQCTDVSSNFKLLGGQCAILYMKGHVGVYLGRDVVINGNVYNVIECTASWEKGILYSYVDITGARYKCKGMTRRNGTWTQYGRPTKWVDMATTVKKSLQEVAKDVISGKYGNGTDRTKKLKAEGYTDEQIKQIQSLVNELCKQPSQTTEVWHTVKSGEIASVIAKKYGVKLDSIKKLNPSIKNWNLIYPGQKIRIK